MTFRRPLGLDLQGRVRCGELRVRWGVGKNLRTIMLTLIFVFKCVFFAILEGFGNDFGRFWEAKMDVKIDFWEGFQKISIF